MQTSYRTPPLNGPVQVFPTPLGSQARQSTYIQSIIADARKSVDLKTSKSSLQMQTHKSLRDLVLTNNQYVDEDSGITYQQLIQYQPRKAAAEQVVPSNLSKVGDYLNQMAERYQLNKNDSNGEIRKYWIPIRIASPQKVPSQKQTPVHIASPQKVPSQKQTPGRQPEKVSTLLPDIEVELESTREVMVKRKTKSPNSTSEESTPPRRQKRRKRRIRYYDQPPYWWFMRPPQQMMPDPDDLYRNGIQRIDNPVQPLQPPVELHRSEAKPPKPLMHSVQVQTTLMKSQIPLRSQSAQKLKEEPQIAENPYKSLPSIKQQKPIKDRIPQPQDMGIETARRELAALKKSRRSSDGGVSVSSMEIYKLAAHYMK